MTYPLISEYVAAIKNAADNLDKLQGLQPVFDDYGEPIHSSGAFAVVFKMVDESGKFYALKCFTEEQTGRADAYKMIAEELEIVNSSYMMKVEYYNKELFVDSNITEDTEFPVLLMDWIDGVTMDVFIAENYKDGYEMSWLCYRFCKMAAWLRSQPFAHGDIKPDNIIVREDGELVLIDYDGMFVPAMKGQKSPTLGTKDFMHPMRTVDDFDETIDDFTLASIALSLKAISLDSSLYEQYAAPDRLLFSTDDYLNLAESKVITALQSLLYDIELMKLEGLFKYSLSTGSLLSVSFRSFMLGKPEKEKQYTDEELTELCRVTEEELDSIELDETGAKYSKDGKRLLSVDKCVYDDFRIKRGTVIICSNAFEECHKIHSISIPSSVAIIGKGAFSGCYELESISLPDSVTSIGSHAFSYCFNLSSISIPSSVTRIGISLCSNDCLRLNTICVDENNKVFDSRNNCNAIIETKTNTLIAGCHSTIIPSSVTCIGESAFFGCSELTSIDIPCGVVSIENAAFDYCKSTSVSIPATVTNIKGNPFIGCSSLQTIKVDPQNKVYDSRDNCNAIIETRTNKLIAGCCVTNIPKSIFCIGESAFMSCHSLKSLSIPYGVEIIEKEALAHCTRLYTIIIPSTIKSIGDSVLKKSGSMSPFHRIANSFGKEKILDTKIVIPMGSKQHFTDIFPKELHTLLMESDEVK